MDKKLKSLFSQLNFSAVFMLLISIAVMFGWVIRNKFLIQISPTFAPMQFNTALGFFVLSIGYLYKLNSSRLRSTSGGFLVLLGGLTLIQYILNLNFGIDELVFDHYIDVRTSHPGRMAPNTALCFFLFGITLLFNSIKLKEKLMKYSQWIVLLIIYPLASLPFLGYVFSVESAYGWFRYTNMALHTATLFLVLTLAQIYSELQKKYVKDSKSKIWSFVLIFGVTASVLLGLDSRNSFESSYLKNIESRNILKIKQLKVLLKYKLENLIYDFEGKIEEQALNRYSSRPSFLKCFKVSSNNQECSINKKLESTYLDEGEFLGIQGVEFERIYIANSKSIGVFKTPKLTMHIYLKKLLTVLLQESKLENMKIEIRNAKNTTLKKKADIEANKIISGLAISFNNEVDLKIVDNTYPEIIMVLAILLSSLLAFIFFYYEKTKYLRLEIEGRLTNQTDKLARMSHALNTRMKIIRDFCEGENVEIEVVKNKVDETLRDLEDIRNE